MARLNSGLSAHGRRRYVRKAPQADTGATPAPNDAVSVPEGLVKVSDLLDWAGSDPDKAQAVLDQETAKPKNQQRKTLVAQLTDLILEG